MGALGNLLGGGGSTLQDFLDFFSQADGRWANQIDPYNTFDVNIKFWPVYPTASQNEDKKLLDTIGNAAVGMVKNGVNNLVNNATGGLVASLINDIKGTSITGQKEKFSKAGVETFLEYLVPANLFKSIQQDQSLNSGWFGTGDANEVSPLEMNIGMYCQEITIPNMKIADMSETETMLGKIPINGTMVIPDNNNLQLLILNTKVPLLERIFYPWMREVTLPFWSYDSQPYTTATITIDFTKHSDVKYVFCGCRPTYITSQQGKQQNGDVTRLVTMTFDFMFVTSDLQTMESTADKLLGTAGGLASGAANMVGL